MANLNKVMLIGRLTREPEIKEFSNGGKVANIGFAVNNNRKNAQTGQWEDVPVWECEGKAEFEAVEKLEAGICPECGEPIGWGKVVDIKWLSVWSVTDVGGGYFRLADTGLSPPGLPDDVKQRLYWIELIHRAEVEVAMERAKREAAIEAEYQVVFWRELLN